MTNNNPITLEDVKRYALGEWKSISMEIRPSQRLKDNGQIGPTFLRRTITYLPGDIYIGKFTFYVDQYGIMPLIEFEFHCTTIWGEAHTIADGAWEIDHVLDQGFYVTTFTQKMTDEINKTLPEYLAPFEVDEKKDLLNQSFPLLGIEKDQIVTNYDLIYFNNGFLFSGAIQLDGIPASEPEDRPYHLQIPLKRTKY